MIKRMMMLGCLGLFVATLTACYPGTKEIKQVNAGERTPAPFLENVDPDDPQGGVITDFK